MAGANLSVGINNTQFNAGIKEINSGLRTIKSEFNLASAQAKAFGTQNDQLKAKTQELTQKIQLQSNQLQLLKQRTRGVGSEILEQKKKQSDLAAKIDATTKSYKESCEQTGKNSEQSKALKSELDSLKEAYARNEDAIKSKTSHLQSLKNRMMDTEAGIINNEKALKDLNQEIINAKFDNLANGLDKVGSAAESAGKKLSVISAGITAGGVASYKLAANFEESMAKVMTIADETEVSYDDLKGAIIDLSDETGISAGEIADNVYNAISAGQSTGDAVAFVAESTKLAKAGFADAGAALDVLTTTLNSYGLESEEAARVSDVLVSIQNEGKTTVGELASNMGKIIPTAKNANLSVEQLGAGYSVMTQKGIATAESTTYMNSMLTELTGSGKAAAEALKEHTGKTFVELMNDGQSLGDVLVILEGIASESGKSLSDMFGGAEAGRAAMTLATDSGQAFNEALESMNNSLGSTDKAFETVSNTQNQQFREATNAAKNAAMDLGTELMTSATPMVQALTTGIKEASEWFRTLDSDQKQTVIQVGLVVAAIGPGLIVFGKLTQGISSTVTGLKDFYNGTKSAIEKVQEFSPQILDGVKNLGSFAKTVGTSTLNLGKQAVQIGINAAQLTGSFAKSIATSTLELGKQAIQFGINTAQMIAGKAATLATTVATNGMAVAQGALNVVMAANPIGLVVIAIGGLAAAFVTLWNKCDWFREKVTGFWENIKSTFNNGIQKLKSFMNFEWSLPKIKLPHFSISGSFSLNPPSIPKFGIEWYHTGAIFKNRTILPGGIGVGDKYKGTGVNAEAIVPLDEMYTNITNIINKALDKDDPTSPKTPKQPIVIVVQSVLDGKVISESTAEYDDLNAGQRLALAKRGVKV